MSGKKSTSVPKEAVPDVHVRGTPLAESDATLDESRRSLPAVDASGHPFFGPLNRSAPAAVETNAAAEDSAALSTPSGTPSKKSEAESRAVSSRPSSDITDPSDLSGSIADASASVDEGRRTMSSGRFGEDGGRANGSLMGESSGDIPYDTTGDLAESLGSTASASALKASTAPSTPASAAEASVGSLPSASTGAMESSRLSTPPATPETSGQAAVRTMHQELIGVTPSKKLKVDREFIELEKSPMSVVLERTEPSLAGSLAATTESTASASALMSSTAPSTPASAAEASVGSLPSASMGALESSAVSSPPASPSMPNASAEAAVLAAEASVGSLPSASIGAMESSALSTPPATPETSGQAAVRVIHEELRGVTPSKKLKVDREFMDLENSPLSAVLERTEPSLEAGNNDEPLWLRTSSAESSNTSDPKPKAVKRRLPTDAVPNDRSTPRRLPVRARRSRLSSSSSASSGPCCSKDVPRSRRHCPTCRCEDTMFPPIDEVNNALSDFNGYFEEDAPAEAASAVAPALDDLSSDESSIEEDPLADMMSDDEVPAEPPVPACPRCGRNCTCVPVQIPEPEVPRPRRRRAVPTMSLEDAWKALKFIDDFEMADLPAAPSKFDKDFYLIEGRPLTKDRLKKFGCTDDFQVGLYEDGEVVFQGSFPGVSTTTELLRRATYQPVLAYHVPEDPVKDIEVGDDYFVMITEAGHLLSLGANDEGQLGAAGRSGLLRQRAITPVTMRRFPAKKEKKEVGEIVFREISVVGKTTWATDEDGLTYVCGEGFERVLTWDGKRPGSGL